MRDWNGTLNSEGGWIVQKCLLSVSKSYDAKRVVLSSAGFHCSKGTWGGGLNDMRDGLISSNRYLNRRVEMIFWFSGVLKFVIRQVETRVRQVETGAAQHSPFRIIRFGNRQQTFLYDPAYLGIQSTIPISHNY